MIREIFTFVDSSQLISKIHLWNERDKAIAEGLEKRMPFRRVMKQTIEKVMANRDVLGVRIFLGGRLGGAEMARSESLTTKLALNVKTRINIDMSIKEMFFVDMQSGLINKVAIFGDKGYCTKDSTTQMKIKNLHNCTIIAL